jgi:hypothetical protein
MGRPSTTRTFRPPWRTRCVARHSRKSTSDNLPVGITFFGRPSSEPALLKLAYACELATHHRAPPKTTPALPPGEAGK